MAATNVNSKKQGNEGYCYWGEFKFKFREEGADSKQVASLKIGLNFALTTAAVSQFHMKRRDKKPGS